MQRMTIGRTAWIGVCLCLWVLATTGAFANRDNRGNTFYDDRGTGVRISPLSLNFGRQRRSGRLSVAKKFIIRNNSGGPIQVGLDAVDFGGRGRFRLESFAARNFSLGANQSRAVAVQMLTDDVGRFDGQVQLTINGIVFEIPGKNATGGVDLAGEVIERVR